MALASFFDPAPDDSRRAPRRIFWIALAVRILYMTLAHTWRIKPIYDHFEFGGEMGRIGRALATGYGFADPFEGHTGPTAWTPPLYPLLIGAVFRVFGVYSALSAWVLFAINSVFSAWTAPAVYQIARRTFTTSPDARKIALWSAWLWALYPAAMQYAVRWVWDMSLTACIFAWLLVLALELRSRSASQHSHHSGEARIPVLEFVATDPPPGHSPAGLSSLPSRPIWLLYGLLWGLIALANSALLAFLPFCTLWITWPSLRTVRAWTNMTLAGIVCIAVIAPWTIRNQLAFHAFVPLRNNFGAELYESARLENEGYPSMATLPHTQASPEFQRYKQLGELEYSRQLGAQAKTVIRAQPARYASHILRRLYFFWFGVPHPTDMTFKGTLVETGRLFNFALLSLSGLLGLALALRHRREYPAAWLFLWAFLSIPALYYVVTVQARFRHPLEPIICVLAVFLFRSAGPRRRAA